MHNKLSVSFSIVYYNAWNRGADAITTTTDTPRVRGKQHLQLYIAAFHAADLETVKGSLAEHIQIFDEDKLAGEGRDSILPFYEKDFKVGKQAHMHKPPRVVVDVDPSSSESQEGKDQPTISMGMVYTYDAQAMVQVCHNIRNVVTTRWPRRRARKPIDINS